ncbi:MAG: hypothetical protein HOP10_07905 [Chitinophagaceae bacterium]|nr:hypothetical protein [Chitinophagaceae bacterium]
MTRIITSAALLLLLSIAAIAQNKTLPLSENKYRINLPDYWGHGNKVWNILTEKLPLVSEELKDKEVCGDDCHPKYSIDFYITEPELTGYTRYKKPKAVSTSTRALVNKIPGTVLVPGSYSPQLPAGYYNQAANNQPEQWQMTAEYVFQCFLLLKDDTGRIITKFILVDTNEVWSSAFKGSNTEYSSPQNPDVFFETYKEKFTPDKFELLAIVDKKILAL